MVDSETFLTIYLALEENGCTAADLRGYEKVLPEELLLFGEKPTKIPIYSLGRLAHSRIV